MNQETLLNNFAKPPARYRGKPFWSWNGELTPDEILRQARIIQEMGFGGYFMHSRVGLVTEYLGDEWFDLINLGADEAARLGMEAWLYDEDRWPSGSAGGLAARDERLRLQGVRLTLPQASEFQWHANVLGAFVCRLEGKNFFDCREIKPGQRPTVASDETLLVFTRETMPPLPFYNGHGYIDTTNPEATAEFIRLTHERYVEKCGDRMSITIRGIFTDEPHRGMISSIASPFSDPEWVMPWGAHFAESFQERFGYDVRRRLPEVFLRPEGRRISQVKWQYVEHLMHLFLESFMKPVHDWCKAHRLILTGHLLHEDSLTSETLFNGSMMRNYEHMDAPGVDMLWEGNRSYWGVKKVASMARQFGKQTVLSELYGCTGWQFNFKSHKAVGNWQALFGINLRCPHLGWYTMKGEAKRDYPASVLHQSAWYPEYRHVEDYFSRIHVLMEQGQPVCDLLVINPVETVWAQIYQGWAQWLYPNCPNLQSVEDNYKKVFHWLAGNHFDFDYGDEDVLARHGSVAGNLACLKVGAACYKAVVVAGLETIRSTTLKLLEAFADAGGRVIFAGPAPAFVDAVECDRARVFAARTSACDLNEIRLVNACLDAVGEPPVSFRFAEGGRTVNDVFCQVRRAGEALQVFAINTDWENARRDVAVAFAGRGSIEEWDCHTGERKLLESRGVGNRTEAVLDFPPAGERMLRLVPTPDERLACAERLRETRRETVHGPYAFRLTEPNVCVLDCAHWRLDNGAWQPPTEILRIDKAIREALGIRQRGGDMVQPWFARKHLPPPESKGRLELRFEFDVEMLPEEPVEFVMESPECFEVFVNGCKLDLSEPRGGWVDCCFKRFVLPLQALRDGANELRLACAFHDGVDLEAVYLLGGFGVRLEESRRILTRLPERLLPGCVTRQGLPFYGAGIVYELPLEKCRHADERRFLELPSFEAACAVLETAEGHPQIIAWPPCEAEIDDDAANATSAALRVVLTRRNTFGPLHQLPMKSAAYHPGSFRTEGRAWSDQDVLYPAGLLAPPVISIRVRQSNFGEEKA